MQFFSTGLFQSNSNNLFSVHSIFHISKETCTLVYEGGAPLGQYSVLIMVEDFPSSDREAEPFSTVPVHLLITGQCFISTFTSTHLLFEAVNINSQLYIYTTEKPAMGETTSNIRTLCQSYIS